MKKRNAHTWKNVGAVVLALLISAGLVIGGMQLWGTGKTKPSNWGKKDPAQNPPATEQGDNAGMTVRPDEQAPGTTGISFVVTEIPREMFAAYEIDPIAETASRLTATVTPQGAEDAVLDWTVAWKDGGSGKWGSGKTVTDYVTVTPTSDGALTANISCTQAFGEQIIVTAAIRGNADVKGTCTVDYARKYETLNIRGTCNVGTEDWSFSQFLKVNKFKFPSSWVDLNTTNEILFGDLIGETTITASSSVYYTIASSLGSISSVTFITRPSPELQAKLDWYNDLGGDCRTIVGSKSEDNTNFYEPAIAAYSSMFMQINLFSLGPQEQETLTAAHFIDWKNAMTELDPSLPHFIVEVTAKFSDQSDMQKTYAFRLD